MELSLKISWYENKNYTFFLDISKWGIELKIMNLKTSKVVHNWWCAILKFTFYQDVNLKCCLNFEGNVKSTRWDSLHIHGHTINLAEYTIHNKIMEGPPLSIHTFLGQIASNHPQWMISAWSVWQLSWPHNQDTMWFSIVYMSQNGLW